MHKDAGCTEDDDDGGNKDVNVDIAEEVEVEVGMGMGKGRQTRGPDFSTSWQIVCQHIRIVYGSQSKQKRVFV